MESGQITAGPWIYDVTRSPGDCPGHRPVPAWCGWFHHLFYLHGLASLFFLPRMAIPFAFVVGLPHLFEF